MGTITANELITRAATQLQDPDHTRWSMAQLLDWLHDAQRDIVAKKPDAYTKSASTVLVVSECKQSLPSDAIMLLDITRNMGTDGSTLGRVPSRIERRVLDQTWPDWMTNTGAAEVINYMYDERDPLNYYVYPPQPAATPGYLELVYSAVPPPVIRTWSPATLAVRFEVDWDGNDGAGYSASWRVLPTIKNDHLYWGPSVHIDPTDETGDTEPTWPTTDGGSVTDNEISWQELTFDVPYPITLDDQYAIPMLDYMLFRAFSVDGNTSPVSGQRAIAHFEAYMSAIGATEQAETRYDPNVPSPAKPSTRGV